MQFEHIAPDGNAKCVTHHVSCIDISDCSNQAAHGWKFRLDGKSISLNGVKQLVGEANGGSTTQATQTTSAGKKVRAVRCKNNKKVYRNMSEAAKDLGLDSAQISYSLKVGRPTKGYEFEFVDEVESVSGAHSTGKSTANATFAELARKVQGV